MAVLKSKKNKNKLTSTKLLEIEIQKLYTEKKQIIDNILIVKSAFSIIDEMFVKEMENAEIMKTFHYKIMYFCCCGYIIDQQINDPKKLSYFIETVMDPYGIQDKEDEIIRINNKKSKKLQDKQLKVLCKEIDDTKKLLNCNIIKTDELYEKLESGQLCEKNLNKNNEENKIKRINIPKIGHIFRLFGEDDDNIKIKIGNNENRSRSNSDSTDAMMDFDIICEKSKNTDILDDETNMTNNIKDNKENKIIDENHAEIANTKVETPIKQKLASLEREVPKIVDTKNKQPIITKTSSKNK